MVADTAHRETHADFTLRRARNASSLAAEVKPGPGRRAKARFVRFIDAVLRFRNLRLRRFASILIAA